jgi:hypothetical protein
MSQSEKPFSVSDRRHFTPDGQARDEGALDQPDPSPADAARAASPADAPGPVTEAAEEERKARAAGPADFGEFLLSLGAQAGMLLSQAGQPDAATAPEALAGARSIISILEMLRDKTEGRRTTEEDRVIEGLLFELRMAYVERSRAGKP